MSKFARSKSQTIMSGSLRNLAIAVTALALVTSCRSKTPKVEEPAPGAGADSGASAPQISNKDINFDPAGSDSGRIAGLATIYFEYDKASLSAETRRTLSDNSTWVKNNPNVTIQIEGHTDERGSVEYNLALGERRAKSVKAYLATLGVDGKRLSVISYGKEKPIAAGDGESAWSKNRRANFVPLAQ